MYFSPVCALETEWAESAPSWYFPFKVLLIRLNYLVSLSLNFDENPVNYPVIYFLFNPRWRPPGMKIGLVFLRLNFCFIRDTWANIKNCEAQNAYTHQFS